MSEALYLSGLSKKFESGSPIITVSPPPLVTVDQSFTFVINCTAMGIPRPQVSLS